MEELRRIVTDISTRSWDLAPLCIEANRLRSLTNNVVSRKKARVILLDAIATVEQELGQRGASAFRAEGALDEIALSVRVQRLKEVHSVSDSFLKSPSLFQNQQLASGSWTHYTYERLGTFSCFAEERLKTLRQAPGEWLADHFVFSSGMSAIVTFIASIAQAAERASPHQVLGYGGYFETKTVFGSLGALQILEWCGKEESFFERLVEDRPSILWVEPIGFNSLQSTIDLNRVLQLICTDSNVAPLVLVLDVSLLGEFLRPEAVLQALGSFNGIVAFVGSSLKLHQQGLELSNAGFLSIYALRENQCFNALRERLTENRTRFGAAARFDEISALDNEMFFDRTELEEYRRSISASNAQFAHAVVPQGGLIAGLVHEECVFDDDACPSPFVTLELGEQTGDDLAALLGLIVFVTRKTGMGLQIGSSFGFRHDRLEVIRPDEDKRAYVRVAMGVRNGPSARATTLLFERLTNLRSGRVIRAYLAEQGLGARYLERFYPLLGVPLPSSKQVS